MVISVYQCAYNSVTTALQQRCINEGVLESTRAHMLSYNDDNNDNNHNDDDGLPIVTYCYLLLHIVTCHYLLLAIVTYRYLSLPTYCDT